MLQGLEFRYMRAGGMGLLRPLTSSGADGLSALTGGGMLMLGKTLAAIAVVFAVLFSGWLWLQEGQGKSPDLRPTALDPPADVSVATADPEALPGKDVSLREEAASAAQETEGEPYGALAVHVRWHDGTAAPSVLISLRA